MNMEILLCKIVSNLSANSTSGETVRTLTCDVPAFDRKKDMETNISGKSRNSGQDLFR